MGAPRDVLSRAAKVKLVVFDVDGVLTDGRLLLGDNGVEYKAFHSRDGHGMKMLKGTGIELAIITGRRSQLVAERMASLGITHVHQDHSLVGEKRRVVSIDGVERQSVVYG